MGTEVRFYFALIFLAAFLSIYSCVLIWRRRHSGLGKASFLMILAVTVWMVPYVMELMLDEPSISVIFMKISFVGAFYLPVTWVIYAAFLIGKDTWITYRRVILLMIIPAILFILVVTDQFWTAITFVYSEGISFLEVDYSDWLIVWMIFSYTLDGIGILLIIWSVIHAPRRYLWRGGIILVAVMLPILANAEFFFGLIPKLQIDLTPFAILFTVMIMIWGGLRFQLFDVVPVARDSLVDRIADGMVVLDEEGRVLDLNLAARHILGKTLSQARFMRFKEILPEVSHLMSEKGPSVAGRNELKIQRYGQEIDFDVVFSPINNRKGDLAGSLVVLHDITELKRGEKSLEEALQKEKILAETRSRFVAVASHAFRTPLTAIKSSADLLDAYYERWPEEKRRDHLARIRQSVSEMSHLLKRMLTYEELQSGKIMVNAGEVDLVELCQRVVRDLPVDRQARASLKIECGDLSIPAIQDEALIYQVLTNLLSNAFKYSPPGSPVKLALRVEGETVLVEVADKGVGIPEIDLPHLGEAFFRGSNSGSIPGSGLGLLIVKRALSMIGGEFQAESDEQTGTLMRVSFPLKLPAARTT